MIGNWPLQIHSSAIVFSPRDNIFRSIHINDVPRWLLGTSYTGEICSTLLRSVDIRAAHEVKYANFTPDRKHVVITSRHHSTVVVHDIQNRGTRTTLEYDAPVEQTLLSHDGQKVVCVTGQCTDEPLSITIRDNISVDESICIRTTHLRRITAIAISIDDKWIISGSDDKTLKIWDATTGNLARTLSGHKASVLAIVVSSDGRWIVSRSSKETIIWSFGTGTAKTSLASSSSGWNTVLAISPDCKYIALETTGGVIEVWAVDTGTLENSLWGPNLITTVDFSPDSQRLVSGSHQGIISVWNMRTGQVEQIMTGHTAGVLCIAFIQVGRAVISFAKDKSLRLWEVHSAHGNDLTGPVKSVAFSPNGQYVASVTQHRISIREVKTDRIVRELSDSSDHTGLVVWSQDGQLLLAGSTSGHTKVWNTTTGMAQYHIAHRDQVVTAVAFSSYNRTIAIGFSNSAAMDMDQLSTFAVWNASTGVIQNLSIVALTRPSVVKAIMAFADGWRIAAIVEKRFHSRLWDSLVGTSHGREVWVGNTVQTSRKLRWSKKAIEYECVLKEKQRIIYFLDYFPTNRADQFRFSSDGTQLRINNDTYASGTCGQRVLKTPEPRFDLKTRSLWVSDSSIRYAGAHLLHLPPELSNTCYDVYENHVAVGVHDGQVLMFKIDRELLSTEAESWPPKCW